MDQNCKFYKAADPPGIHQIMRLLQDEKSASCAIISKISRRRLSSCHLEYINIHFPTIGQYSSPHKWPIDSNHYHVVLNYLSSSWLCLTTINFEILIFGSLHNDFLEITEALGSARACMSITSCYYQGYGPSPPYLVFAPISTLQNRPHAYRHGGKSLIW